MSRQRAGAERFALETVMSVIIPAAGGSSVAAVNLAYAALLPNARKSVEPLADQVDRLLLDFKSGRRWLCFDRLARPLGFCDAGHASGQPDAITRKKDVLDHAAGRVRELLAVGEVLLALRAAPAYARAHFGVMAALAMTLVGTGQYRLYKDRSGAPAGMLSWAWVSDWTLDRLRINPLSPLHPCEWSEGEHLYLRDLAFSASCLDELAADVAGRLFPDEPWCLVALTRARAAGPVLKRLAASQRSAFAEWLRSRLHPSQGVSATP